MKFHYPNGKKNMAFPHQQKEKKEINYANRGMTLEKEINLSNSYYLQIGRAVIHKKPTPIQIVKVDYPKRSAAVIREAYFRQASTTDYNGIYKGKYIDFEAKETKQKQSFPLANFQKHQIEHMKVVTKQGGICFVLLRFITQDQVYLLDARHLISFFNTEKRKSIPKAWIEDKGYPIPYGYRPRIDYLSIIDRYYID
ncbi:MAG TPA: Holliday junction resolvase RecU [Massilibacterium sp.]|nr:Holliday junction resolvase RecU [Massilibacterium sp.]